MEQEQQRAPAYAYRKRFSGSFEGAIAQIKDALQAEGFGVLTEIDVAKTLKEKLGVSHPPERILGVCNPKLAFRAIQEEPDIALLLPCTVVVSERNGSVSVAMLLPTKAMEIAGNESLGAIAAEAEERLRRALDACCDGSR